MGPLAYQRIGVRAYLRSTYDPAGGNEGADAPHFLYQLADDFNVSLDLQDLPRHLSDHPNPEPGKDLVLLDTRQTDGGGGYRSGLDMTLALRRSSGGSQTCGCQEELCTLPNWNFSFCRDNHRYATLTPPARF